MRRYIPTRYPRWASGQRINGCFLGPLTGCAPASTSARVVADTQQGVKGHKPNTNRSLYKNQPRQTRRPELPTAPPAKSTQSIQSTQSPQSTYDPVIFDLESSTLLLSLESDIRNPNKLDISHILSRVPTNKAYTPESLLHIVQNRLDGPSTLSLIRLLIPSVHHIPPVEAMTIIPFVVRCIGDNDMISPLELLLSIFYSCSERAVRNGDIDQSTAQDKYQKLIRALNKFSSKNVAEDRINRQHPSQNIQSKAVPLPLAVRRQVARIAQHLFDMLEQLPRSSRSKIEINSGLLRRLFSQHVLSTQLAKVLTTFAIKHEIPLKATYLHRCVVVAMDEDDLASVKKYMRLKNRATTNLAPNAKRSRGLAKEEEEEEEESELDEEDALAVQYRLDKEMDRLILARKSTDLASSTAVLQPHLSPPSTTTKGDPKTQAYAWSILLTQAAQQQNASAHDLIELYRHMPHSAICAQTLTPIMKGLLDLKAKDAAWELWLESVDLQKKQDQEESTERSPRYVDRYSLAVATAICKAKFGLNAAVTLVDEYAVRKRYTPEQNAGRIQLDAANVNALLRACVTSRAPSVAFRLWVASNSRWGVTLDGNSLARILDAARYCEIGGKAEVWVDDFHTRFKMLMNEFSFRRRGSSDDEGLDFAPGPGTDVDGSYRAYDADGFSKGDARVLLDPPGFKWYKHFGSYRPWQQARSVFRSVVLGNWPLLASCRSPLDLDHEGWTDSLFGARLASPSHVDHHRDHIPRKKAKSPHGQDTQDGFAEMEGRIPDLDARYTHILPTQKTWTAYVKLLGTFGKVDEIPLAFSWMRELKIKPSFQAMTLALTFVGEVEGPRRRVRGWREDGGSSLVRDEEILRRWLEDWLVGELGLKGREKTVLVEDESAEGGRRKERVVERTVVPTELDVMAYRRSVMETGRRLIL